MPRPKDPIELKHPRRQLHHLTFGLKNSELECILPDQRLDLANAPSLVEPQMLRRFEHRTGAHDGCNCQLSLGHLAKVYVLNLHYQKLLGQFVNFVFDH